MDETSAEKANRPPSIVSVPDLPERESEGATNAKQYDPHIPDEVMLQNLNDAGPGTADSAALHAEAFRSTPGEELRPKDGTLDGGTAR